MGMSETHTVLFLCTGNSCRSQMAEAMLRHLGQGRFQAVSAGSHPAGFVHPLAIETMSRMGMPIENQASKSWDEFTKTPVDAVITLCDAAAAESCPTWLGSPSTAQWSLPDPAFHPGADEERVAFAMQVAQRLKTKLEQLVQLDWSAPVEERTKRLRFLGEI